jgi:hypothetical protein
MKADEAFDPVHVALLGSRRVVPDTQRTAESIQEARRFGKGEFAHIDTQEAMIEEVERLARLFEGGQRIFLGVGKMFEEAGDLGQAQLARMAFAVKEDEVMDAVGEALAGFGPAVVGEGGLTKLVEEARGVRSTAGRIGTGCGIEHGRTSSP